MNVLTGIDETRRACAAARARGGRVGLVPTMGSFHAGHRSLMRTAREQCDLALVSLFVNPTQFGPTEDLASYPRDLAGDTATAAAEGIDLVFAPAADTMYPDGPPRTSVHVAGLTDGLCGTARPTHFDGVATVVAKLLAIVGPCRAYFGRKDYQQLAMVRQMVRDLDLPVEVVGCPLVREPDGLAMSSRNAYLTPDERVAATVLVRALCTAAEAVRAGERSGPAVEAIICDMVGAEPLVTLEYAELRDAGSLAPVAVVAASCVLAIAARVGRARLLDNVVLEARGDEVDVDLGVVANGE